MQKAREKKEIQEGLIKACDVIDLIIEILRGSKNIKDAKACLINGDTSKIKFKSEISKIQAGELHFTEKQASAILDMRLYKLIGLELDALKKEYEETLNNIATYEDILENRSSMAKVIIKQLNTYKKNYGRERRTVIDNLKEAVVVEEKIKTKDVVFLMDRFGYAKTVDVSVYERNKEAADSENRIILTVKNTDKLCLFTEQGQMHLLKIIDLPHGKFRDKGSPIDNLSNYDSKEERLIFVDSILNLADKKLLFITKKSMIKVVDGKEFDVTRRTTSATKLNDDDILLNISIYDENNTIVMRSRKEMFLRFACNTIPEKKKGAVGVRGMRLADNDEIIETYFVSDDSDTISVDVKGKEVVLNRLHVANRDTKGVKK